MSSRPLFTTGLVMPKDFDVEPYEAIHLRVSASSKVYPDSWAQYAGAWNAVAYRFLSCADHDRTFTESIQRAGDAPAQPERYIQERELFGFFVTGLAAIESLCYGLFAIASMLDSQNFPIKTPSDMKSITPKKTAKQFKEAFPRESITTALNKIVTAQEFREWKEIRNILAHRVAPGRVIYLSTKGSSRAALWETGIQLDKNTTASRREWLARTMNALLREADGFTKDHFL